MIILMLINPLPNYLFILQRKIENPKNREKLSSRKLAKEYYNETGEKVGKTTVNNMMKNNFGLHYLKTTPKSKFLTKDLGILYSMYLIKIFTRSSSVSFQFLLMKLKLNYKIIILNYGDIEMKKYILEIHRNKKLI